MPSWHPEELEPSTKQESPKPKTPVPIGAEGFVESGLVN